jgi:hypothetical protein
MIHADIAGLLVTNALTMNTELISIIWNISNTKNKMVLLLWPKMGPSNQASSWACIFSDDKQRYITFAMNGTKIRCKLNNHIKWRKINVMQKMVWVKFVSWKSLIINKLIMYLP